MLPVLPPSAAALAFAAVLILPSLVGEAAGPLEVTVRPTFATEPAFVRVTASVERHPDNRWLVVEADAPTVFRSSHRQLDGEFEARTHIVEFLSLPAGNYKIIVRVSGPGGDLRAIERRDFKVIGGS